MKGPASTATTSALDAARESLAAVDLSWLQPEAERHSWTLADDTLRFLTGVVAHLRPARVVEFGSGLSTRVLAAAAAASTKPGASATVVALENDPLFARRTTAALAADGALGRARVELTHLVVRRWYGRNVPVYDLPKTVGEAPAPQLVLVDGPPLPLGGRAGSLLQAVHLAEAGSLVLLDDADRPSEQAALAMAQKVFGSCIEISVLDGFAKGLAAVVVHRAVGGSALPPTFPGGSP
ncbi:MAG TPA: hypothetical protein VG455_15710 [Acidimicrobiales bacterium]|nr:hypothetical protein [Acidimicrobiales bacterium]